MATPTAAKPASDVPARGSYEAFQAIQNAAREVANWFTPSCGWDSDVLALRCAIEQGFWAIHENARA